MNQFKENIESTIQLYLRNELDDELAIAFEDYFVDKPELIEKIDTARDMMHALEQLDASELSLGVASSASDNQSQTLSSVWAHIWSILAIPTPAYVSAALCLAIIGVLGFPDKPVSDSPTLIGFSTQLTRSADHSVYVDLSSVDENRAVFIKVPSVDYRAYRLSVIDPSSNATVWQSDSFLFSALKDRIVLIPASIDLEQAKLELLADREGQTPIPVKFCHYSEPC